MIVLSKTHPYSGAFFHGIDLSDFFPCWNLSLFGELTSAEFSSYNNVCLPSPKSIRTTILADLKTPYMSLGAVTPRAMYYVWCAAIVRAGGHVGIGVPNTTWLAKTEMERILRIGDIEIEFEETRRSIAPDAASRLCCLWVTDATDAGRNHIHTMLGAHTYILEVSIPEAVRVTRTDTRWFDEYCRTQKKICIEQYWRSQPFDDDLRFWEYLVEGKISVSDPSQIAHIQLHGGHRELMAAPATH